MTGAETSASGEHLVHTLLRPPEVPTVDALLAGGRRLRAGMKSGAITHRQANEAWRAAIAKTPIYDGP